MGDIGDYWREHKEYKQSKKYGAVPKHDDPLTLKMKAEAKAARLAKHTISCECGRTFLDVNAHNSHKMHTGKKGHKGTPITNPQP